MSGTFAGFSPDAALIAAEREYRELLAECDRLAELDTTNDALDRRLSEVEALIADTTPRTLADVAVKLRLLLDQIRRGWDVSDRDDDVPALRQVLALVERVDQEDQQILSLFRRWIEAYRSAAEIGEAGLESHHDAACDAFREIEHKIVDTQAQGPIGLSIKAYLIAHDAHGGSRECAPAGLRDFEPGTAPECTRSLMRDAARFVPEIAELAAPMIGQPPPADPGGNVVPLRQLKP